jgi:hypothetical protein
LALAQGWYEQRQRYQLVFIVAIAVCALLSVCALALLLRSVLRRAWLLLVGLAWVLGFVVVRAASFHHIDLFLRSGSVRWNWVLELSGIAIVGWAGYRASSRPRAREA